MLFVVLRSVLYEGFSKTWKRSKRPYFWYFINHWKFVFLEMKTSKVEKVPISNIANVVMEVLEEMLVLIAERTHCDNSNMGKWI